MNRVMRHHGPRTSIRRTFFLVDADLFHWQRGPQDETSLHRNCDDAIRS